ncbi:nucleotidyltransferase family protein [Novosphingobium sp. MMS21-SN21R]|uniref:nucleotidyltransferase family protein n=1 Tax=Novosphingobium sp. MMS21-SN21R TaxID=2969298 RepID=UPI002887D470|nr:nucleotidyltransferase family protein [Novosphingobium sp. MMS21-SN21R]MDT0507646.1 nucleotidyltransferase family protein [Novosphingobium sp. MMS21-SN21R]
MQTLPDDAMLVARVLSGAWRASPPPCDLTPAQIDRVTPLLTMSGGTALGWWRLKGTPLAPHAETLRGSAQLLALEEMAKDAALSELCSLLNGAGVVPLLFKGWAAARSYPEGWLRPYGDFDLVVRECDFANAHAALAKAATRFHGNDFAMPFGPRRHCSVDLHGRLDAFYDADVEILFSRAHVVSLPKGTLLAPSPEDHLRLCAIHMFRHGAWRPLWLCDVAAMSEAAGPDFDWDSCLGKRPATAAWTAAAVMLAQRLLGARSEHLPLRVRNQCVPDWLEETVLRYWSYPHAGQINMSGDVSFRDPLAKLRWHWPDAIKATIWSGGLPAPGSRLPWKLRRCAATMGQAVQRKFRRA